MAVMLEPGTGREILTGGSIPITPLSQNPYAPAISIAQNVRDLPPLQSQFDANLYGPIPPSPGQNPYPIDIQPIEAPYAPPASSVPSFQDFLDSSNQGIQTGDISVNGAPSVTIPQGAYGARTSPAQQQADYQAFLKQYYPQSQNPGTSSQPNPTASGPATQSSFLSSSAYNTPGVQNPGTSSQPNPTASNPATQSSPLASSTPRPSMNPYTQTETQAGVSDYAMPYVENMLGATQAQLFNTDASGNLTGLKGYTPYSYNAADYFAGFTPLQQQAQQGVANLSLPSSFGQAMGLTGQTYGNLMGLGRQAGMAGQNYAMQATNPYAISSYMNPYLQASLAPQMQLLQQQQAQQGQQLASQASQAGAFGGSRYGIQQGLQNQANQLAMSNLVGQGYNNAYNQALQNMQFGSNLGLQGQQAAAGMYGQGLNAANQLANIGNTALGAQQGILNTQQQTGATQQGLQQQILNQAVQNYNTAQQYPYQQLGFMQNMLQGLPISTQSVQNYQQAPSMAQNLAALGMGAYGLNSLLGGGSSGSSGSSGLTGLLNSAGSAIGSGLSNVGSALGLTGSGGLLSSFGFAEGGSVESPGNIESIVGQLSDQQLQQAAQAAQARGDMQEVQTIQEEMATRASERGGLAGAFNQLPQQQRTAMARGGMVAFADNPDQPVDQNMPSTGGLYDTNRDPLLQSIRDSIPSASPDSLDSGYLARLIKPNLSPAEIKHRENLKAAAQQQAPVQAVIDRQNMERERAANMAAVNAPSTQYQPSANPAPKFADERIIGATPVDSTVYSNQDLQNMAAQQTDQNAARGPAMGAQPAARPAGAQPVARPVAQPANSADSIYSQLIKDLNTPPAARKDREVSVRENMEFRRRMLGENPADAMAASMIKQQDEDRISALNQGKGLAALSAMSGMLQPGGFMRGLAAAGGQFSSAFGKVLADDRTARSNLMQAQIHLADSKYKAMAGDFDSARQDYKDYEDRMDRADAADKARKMGIADILHKMETEKNQRAQIEATKAYHAASGETSIQKIADDLMKSDSKMDRRTALNEASKIAGYSYRTEQGMNAKLQAALSKIDERAKLVNALGNTQMGQQMRADLERQRQEAYRLYGQPGGVTSDQAAPAAGGMKIIGVR
jgi:hypothetical protein